jgi:hypothetical protein
VQADLTSERGTFVDAVADHARKLNEAFDKIAPADTTGGDGSSSMRVVRAGVSE